MSYAPTCVLYWCNLYYIIRGRSRIYEKWGAILGLQAKKWWGGPILGPMLKGLHIGPKGGGGGSGPPGPPPPPDPPMIMIQLYQLRQMFFVCIPIGYGDLTFDLTAYTHGAVSDFAQALSLVMIQRITDIKCLSAVETLHLNSVNAMPLLFVCSAISGEFGRATHQFSSKDVKFMVIFIIVVCSGCLLNYVLFLCTTLNSALTTSVVGTLKSIVQTVVGTWTFGGFSVNAFTVTGISLNLFGTCLYIYAKYQEIMRKRRLSSSRDKTREM